MGLLELFIVAFCTYPVKPYPSPMQYFNAFQITAIFSAMPFLVGWLYHDPFPYSIAAFWASIIVYFVMFIWIILAMAEFIRRESR